MDSSEGKGRRPDHRRVISLLFVTIGVVSDDDRRQGKRENDGKWEPTPIDIPPRNHTLEPEQLVSFGVHPHPRHLPSPLWSEFYFLLHDLKKHCGTLDLDTHYNFVKEELIPKAPESISISLLISWSDHQRDCYKSFLDNAKSYNIKVLRLDHLGFDWSAFYKIIAADEETGGDVAAAAKEGEEDKDSATATATATVDFQDFDASPETMHRAKSRKTTEPNQDAPATVYPMRKHPSPLSATVRPMTLDQETEQSKDSSEASGCLEKKWDAMFSTAEEVSNGTWTRGSSSDDAGRQGTSQIDPYPTEGLQILSRWNVSQAPP